MHLGKRIQRMRQVRGLTSVALARRARVTTGFLSQLERSHTVPSLQTQTVGDVAVAQKSPCEGNRVILGNTSPIKLGQLGLRSRGRVHYAS